MAKTLNLFRRISSRIFRTNTLIEKQTFKFKLLFRILRQATGFST